MDSNDRIVKIVMDFSFLILIVLFVVLIFPKIFIFFFPLFIGYFIACFANPIVRFLEEKIKIVRKQGSALVIFLVVLSLVVTLYGIGYLIISQVEKVIVELPEIYGKLQISIEKIGRKYSKIYDNMPYFLQKYCDELQQNIMGINSDNNLMGKSPIKFAKATIQNLTSGILYVIFTIMSAFFFTVDKDKLICKARLIIPGHILGEIRKVFANLKNILGGYIKVQLKIMCILIAVLYGGLFILKIRYSFVIAVVIGVLDFMPILGIGTILLPWVFFTILLGNYRLAIGLGILYFVCLIIRETAEPKMFGKSLGLSTFSTFFIIYLGYKLGGFLGLIFALPLGIICINLVKAGALDVVIEDCKYMYTEVDKFRRETRKSIRDKIDKNI